MKIAILDLTTHPLPRLEGLPTVGMQIMTWLSPLMPEAELEKFHIAEGEKFPLLEEFDGLVISGSEFGVYDDVEWMQPLRELLLRARDGSIPMFGICFGHQIMADTFGGKAEKAECGNQLGVRHYRFGDRQTEAYAWHKDQVTQVPPGASVIATSSYCPVAALAYDFPALSIQFHPEYSERQLRSLFDRFKDDFVPPAEAAKAIESFKDAKVAPDLMAKEAAEFFATHCKAA